jgi:hypothetical protein
MMFIYKCFSGVISIYKYIKYDVMDAFLFSCDYYGAD